MTYQKQASFEPKTGDVLWFIQSKIPTEEFLSR